MYQSVITQVQLAASSIIRYAVQNPSSSSSSSLSTADDVLKISASRPKPVLWVEQGRISIENRIRDAMRDYSSDSNTEPAAADDDDDDAEDEYDAKEEVDRVEHASDERRDDLRRGGSSGQNEVEQPPAPTPASFGPDRARGAHRNGPCEEEFEHRRLEQRSSYADSQTPGVCEIRASRIDTPPSPASVQAGRGERGRIECARDDDDNSTVQCRPTTSDDKSGNPANVPSQNSGDDRRDDPESAGTLAGVVTSESAALARRSRHLSDSISHLNRRATVCLTTIYLGDDTLDLVDAVPAPAETDADVDDDYNDDDDDDQRMGIVEAEFEPQLQLVVKEAAEFVKELEEAESSVTIQDTSTTNEVLDDVRRRPDENEDEEGSSWFRIQKAQPGYKDFDDVGWTEGRGTNAQDFCSACQGLILLADTPRKLEHLVPALAGLCTSDLSNEIYKIRSLTAQAGVSTLEELISVESSQRRKTGTDAINWLLLILDFGTRAYEMNLGSTDKEELSVSFQRAWDQEFYKHFNFLVRPLFKILIKACPSRTSFYAKLGGGGPGATATATATAPVEVEIVETDFAEWLNGIRIVSKRVREWQKKKNNEEKDEEKEKEKKKKKQRVRD